MKVLYATQATGNGHLSRAGDIISALNKRAAVELDVLISGTQADIPVNFPVKYRLNGFSFVFGKSGDISLAKTLFKGNLPKFLKEVNTLPIEEYDLIINDFEPVSAWAAKSKGKICVGLSHHCAVLSPTAPQSAMYNTAGKFICKYYAPTNKQFGFHFSKFDKNIFTPIIRKQIREAAVSDKGHYTVYLPAYGDAELYNFLSTFKSIRWEVFSKHNKSAFKLGNVHVRPLNNDAFVESITSSTGVLCGAGFETPAEALFLNKKLMVIPITNQYEQLCNAEVLKTMGVPVIKKLHEKSISAIAEWIENGNAIHVNYPDITENVVDTILSADRAPEVIEADYRWNNAPYKVSPVL
jgi:uncharacterized protein (TIGR00661 family)